MSKHTPGQWTTGKGQFLVREVDNKRFIARTAMPGYYRGRSDEEAEANAKLIAAAPAMLDVLERLVTYYQSESRPEAVFKLDAARAAIAKARGEDVVD
jgi:hypothetical protein